MANHSRRAILSGGMRASVAAIGAALVPSISRAAAPAGLHAAPSPELLALRANLAERATFYAFEPSSEMEEVDNTARMILSRIAYGEQAQAILDRPVDDWAQIAELAEVAWSAWPKVWHGPMPPNVALDLEHRQDRHWNYVGRAAAAQLIHAVVKMTRGQRFSPCLANGPINEDRLSADELLRGPGITGGAHV
jgi:hypothetical protein